MSLEADEPLDQPQQRQDVTDSLFADLSINIQPLL